MKPLIITLLFLVFFVNLQAQDSNVFLQRDFWKTSPDIEEIEAKIKEGNNPAAYNEYRFDGVVYAILEHTLNKTIKHLLTKEGNNVNKLTHDGRTYLFWAAYTGNTELMQYLINKGATTNLLDDHGYTVLNFAASSGQTNTEVYDICLNHGASLKTDLTKEGANALLLIASFDTDFSLINYFIEKGLSLNSTDNNGNNIFNYAAKRGNINLMTQLLIKNIKGNDQAFMFAAQGARRRPNPIVVFKFLKSTGLNPKVTDKEGNTPLHLLAKLNPYPEVFEFFIENGVDVNQVNNNGDTAFIIASGSNNLDVVSLLYKQIKNINTYNNKKESPIFLALQSNTPEVVSFLLEKKAYAKYIDAKGNNAMYYLMQSYVTEESEAFYKKLSLLKANGVNITKPQVNGNSLYHLAVQKNSIELVDWVAKQEISINELNKEGLTPLHIAAMKAKDTKLLKHLLALGANKDTKTSFGETAYNLAQDNEALKETTIEFLK